MRVLSWYVPKIENSDGMSKFDVRDSSHVWTESAAKKAFIVLTYTVKPRTFWPAEGVM